MNEKVIVRFVFVILLVSVFTGCRTVGTAITEPGDYIKPTTVEAAQYGIDERIANLERQLSESRAEISTVRGALDDCRSEIGNIRKSGEAIIMVSRRSGDLIQETLEQAEALDRWVRWALDRIAYLETLLEAQIQLQTVVDLNVQ